MDIQTGLVIAGNAIDLVKSLRQIEHDLSSAELKAKMADLYGQLADVKMALVDANVKIVELEAELKAAKSGELCPICEEGHLKVVASRPHADFAFAGVQSRTLECNACGHREERMHDPSGITKS